MTRSADECTLTAQACFFIYLVLSLHVLPDATAESTAAPTEPWRHGSNSMYGQSDAALHEDVSPSLPPAPFFEARVENGSARQLFSFFSIEVEPGWEFPIGTKLQLHSPLESTIFGSGKAAASQLNIMAGFRYSAITIFPPTGGQFGVMHNGATIKLGDASVTREQCHILFKYDVGMMSTQVSQASQVIAPSPLAMGSTVRLNIAGNQNMLSKDTNTPHLVFMRGGQYILCYAPDGTFAGEEWRNTLVPVTLNVYGVSSACDTNDCLAAERWECYFSYRAEAQGPCIFDFSIKGREGWTVNAASETRFLWTTAWPSDNYIAELSFPEKCSDSISGHYIQPESQKIDTSSMQEALGIEVDKQTPGSMPSLIPTAAVDSFTVSACYCPNFDGQVAAGPEACVDTSEYIQPFGAVHYWMARICSLENYASCGFVGHPYMRVVPEQPFVLRIQCPPGLSCSGTAENRIKFLDLPDATYEYLPSWHRLNRCQNSKVQTSTAWMWAPKGPGLASLPLDGGTRRDYKVWADRHLIFTLTFGQALDLCYCESNCDDMASYFQVGRIQAAESLGVARWSKDLSTYNPGGLELEPIETIKYLGKPGTVNLFGGVTSPLTEGMLPYDSVPFAKRTLLKLMSFDRELLYPGPSTLEQHLGLNRARGPNAQQQLDAACAAAPYRIQLNDGPSSEISAKEFQAYINANEETKYLTFTGVEQDQTFFVIQAGTVSVCYCAMLSDGDTCEEDHFWLHAAMFMVIGPSGTQRLEYPVNVVVDLEIEGWGFDDSNSIRFIGLAQTCRENNNNPGGVISYRLGCPGINGTGCRKPEILEYLHTFVDTGNSTGVYISEIEISEYNTTLFFTGNIVQYVDDGDAITIEPESVLLSGRPSSTWTAAERNNMAKLTGILEYADDPEDTRYLWKRVNYVYKPGYGDLEPNKLSLPIGWPMGQLPAITFRNNGGVWIRRNKLRTRQEFLALKPAGMKICFAVNDGGIQKHYSEAGSLFFVNPPAMDDAGVRLTSQVIGSVAPVIVTFSPKRGNPNYNQNHDEPIVLRILWQDIDGMLEPLVSYENAANGSFDPIPGDAEVAMENASQALCGQMFLEMWTNDALGFPLPRGCYYGRTYQSQPDSPGQVMPTFREYNIIFEPNNGLKSVCFDYRFSRRGSCSYMLVLNARVGTIKDRETEIATLHAKCAEKAGEKPKCGSKHSVFEWGAGVSNKISLPTESDAAVLDYVEVGPLGTLREGNMPSYWDLDAEIDPIMMGYPWSFEVRAWVQNQSNPIKRSAYLRLFLTPFGVWDVGYSECNAICIPPENFTCSDGRGGSTATCRKEPVTMSPFDGVVRMPRNMIELRYPRRMDELDASVYNVTDEHVLQVSLLLMPPQGFFPRQFMVQLSDWMDVNPSVATTNTSFRRLPTKGTTSGRLLIDGQIGSGPKPFVEDRHNKLFVYLSLGVTLQHDESSDSAPMIEILLPKGYTCLITGDGTPDPDKSMKLFKLDRDGDGYLDYFRGSLKMGSWSSEGQVCWYKLAPMAALYVGTKFYVQIEVHNPIFSVARSDPSNVWQIQIKGMNQEIFGDLSRFIDLREELQYPEWVGNLAVIEPLRGESMQPSRFTVGAKQELTIFFKAVHDMPVYSLLYFDSPTGFDFGDECVVGDAPSETYADFLALPWGEDLVGDRSKTRRLGGIIECAGDVWGLDPFAPAPTANFTRAKMRLAGNLLSQAYYGFTIQVQNAPTYDVSQQNGWTLWVMSPLGYPIDGSRQTIQFNEARAATAPAYYYDRTWGVYERDLRLPLQINFGSPNVLPTPDNLITQQVVIYPLQTALNTFVNLRILAPVGYRWDVFSPDGLHGDVPGVTCERCVLKISNQPKIMFYNELVIDQLVFRGGYKYGIRARIFIPSRPPTRSSNSFYIEMGYNKETGEQRLQASALGAPKLRAIYNAFVYPLCNAAGYADNIIEFHLSTISNLYTNQGFVLRGDEATRGMELLCFPTAARGTMEIPRDIQCNIFPHSLTYLLVVTLSALVTPLLAGHWGFTFHRSRNVPASNTVGPGSFWLIGTYSNIDQFPAIEVIDQAVHVPAPGTLFRMKSAGYLTAPEWEAPEIGRYDQPGVMNSIIFYFVLTERLAVPPKFSTFTIALRGPRGFKFLENCLSGVEVMNGTDGLSANETNETWPCRDNSTNPSWCPTVIEDWPDGLDVVACIGIENSAKVLVKNAGVLEADVPYGIKVSMINAPSSNSTDVWAIDVGEEASEPMAAFPVRTFDVDTTFLFAASPAVTTSYTALNNGMPISLVFTPSVEVPGAMKGTRRLQASTLPMDQAALDFWYYYPEDANEGSLILEAPAGFQFAISYRERLDNACDRSSLEELNRSPLDDEAVFHDPNDVYCTVADTHNGTRMRFLGKKSLQALVTYRLILFVKNPMEPQNFEPWILRTEKTMWKTQQSIQLDRIQLPGYEVSVSFPQWAIDNLSKEFNGGFTVRRIRFTIVFSRDVLDFDTFTIIAPAGFTMGSATNSSCMNFQYATVLLPLLDTPPPTCSQKANGESRLELTINEGKSDGVALEKGRPLAFLVGALNPLNTPDIVQNTWRAYHRRDPSRLVASDVSASGELQSSADDISGNLLGVGVTTSWDIIAPIWNISVAISGPFQRASSVSELSMRLTPTRFAMVMALEIHEPVGFDFFGVQVDRPYLVDEQTSGERLVLSNCSFLAFQTVTIIARNVRLGRAGGPTRMDFRTYETTNLRNEVGGRMNYILGFRLPGALTVFDQYLLSEPVVAHYEQNQTDAVLPLLPMRVGEIARVELTFSITMPVNVGEHLVLSSVNISENHSYIGLMNEPGFRPSLVRCSSAPLTGPNAAAHSTCDPTSEINITAVELVKRRLSPLPHMIKLTLDYLSEDTQSGITTPPPGTPVLPTTENVQTQGQSVLTPVVYRLRVWCHPDFDASFWRLETSDGNPLPTNTNDAITSAIRVVYPMEITVDAIRTPPASMVPATLEVQPGPFPPTLSRLAVVLPLEYSEYLAPELVTFKSTGRVVANIDLSNSQQANLASQGVVVEPRVITPGATGDDPRWFLLGYAWDPSIDIESRTMDNAEMVSWGAAPGWTINQLNVTIAYATIAAFIGFASLYFSVPIKAKGTTAVITAPLGFSISCPDVSDGLVGRPCSSAKYQKILFPFEPSTVNLTLTEASIEGEFNVYSFIIGIRTPINPPIIGGMEWDVRVYDDDWSIVDAAIDVVKPGFVEGMYVTSPFFRWKEPPVAGEASAVSVQFSMTRRVRNIKAILITIPEGYRHDIRHKNQFKSLSKKFPAAIDVEWRNYDNLRWLRILVARPPSEELDFIPSGTYRFEFPVMVPIRKPLATEWYFALCSSYECESVNPPDRHIIVYFPMPMDSAVGEPIDYTPGTLSGAQLNAPCGRTWQVLLAVAGLIGIVRVPSR